MKIAMVYDYSRKKCGIKEYGDALVKWLKALGVDVEVCDLRKESYADSVRAALCACRGDLVHTQHEYGLFKGHFGWSQIFYYLTLKLLRKKDLTTLHTVITPKQAIENYVRFSLPYVKEKFVETFRGLLISALSPYVPQVFSDALLVHTLRGYELLPWIGKMKALFVPHFTPTPTWEVEKKWAECSEKREAPERVEIVTPGFLRPTKRYDWAIHALVSLKAEGLDVPIRYTVIGTTQDEAGERWYSYIKEFVEEIKEDLKKVGLEIVVQKKMMTKEELIRRACGAHIVLLPYSDPTQEASGILHDSLVCGKHIVVPQIGDVRNYPDAFYPFDIFNPLETMKEALRRAINEVLKGNLCNPSAFAYAHFTAIDRVARRHAELYAKLRSGRASPRPP
ncbi:MAG: hypothetical protein GXO07_01185 [Crenarchaeota archaeon]|nr:hypothetical protein [Thermoproteota archaeon]